MARQPNLILLGIDSLRGDHTSLQGYHRHTTPHIERFARDGAVFTGLLSPSIPTTPAYASMLSGLDCFSTDVVALRHRGPIGDHVTLLPELLGAAGYSTVSVGWHGNPSSRGFQKYLEYPAWGSWAEGRSPKARLLNEVAIPELRALASGDAPFFLFLRHMDPHAPYLPPEPFDRMFYGGNELDPANRSLEPVYSFKPFCDFHRSWFPPGCTDKDYVIAQYDGAVAYMDAAIAELFATIDALGLAEDTLVVVTADHGETLYDHECWFDHHSVHDCVLDVPLAMRFPGHIPPGTRFDDMCQTKDMMPTILELLDIAPAGAMDGRSLAALWRGEERPAASEMYLTEATWMRKHGWRTPHWKLIHALEPDFHFKPEVELYDLVADPDENHNVAEHEPEVVALLEARMRAHIARREAETGRTNPMYTNLDWHGHGTGPFETSQEAYDTMHIGDASAARRLQAKAAPADGDSSKTDRGGSPN